SGSTVVIRSKPGLGFGVGSGFGVGVGFGSGSGSGDGFGFGFVHPGLPQSVVGLITTSFLVTPFVTNMLASVNLTFAGCQ
ncbi:hypothetical protein EI534_46690, partial [Pseudomonas frederiksbergensis]|nr:hypothetical protein [Pseudomonas frederiksbergensis]